jgi:hypothetical protein
LAWLLLTNVGTSRNDFDVKVFKWIKGCGFDFTVEVLMNGMPDAPLIYRMEAPPRRCLDTV